MELTVNARTDGLLFLRYCVRTLIDWIFLSVKIGNLINVVCLRNSCVERINGLTSFSFKWQASKVGVPAPTDARERV